VLEPRSLIEMRRGRNKGCMKISKEGNADAGGLPDMGRWGGWGGRSGLRRRLVNRERRRDLACRRGLARKAGLRTPAQRGDARSGLARANRRLRTQGLPAKPGRALGSLPVRPQRGLRRRLVNRERRRDLACRRGLARNAGLRPWLNEGTPPAGWRAGPHLNGTSTLKVKSRLRSVSSFMTGMPKSKASGMGLRDST